MCKEARSATVRSHCRLLGSQYPSIESLKAPWFIIYLKLVFMCGVQYGSNLIFSPYGNSMVPALLTAKAAHSLLFCSDTSVVSPVFM